MKNPFPKMTIDSLMFGNNTQMVKAIFDRLDFIIENLPEKKEHVMTEEDWKSQRQQAQSNRLWDEWKEEQLRKFYGEQ
jgi:hypothetical protein